jgi:hypothetical protein
VRILKLIITEYSPASRHFLLLRSKYSLQYLFSNIFNLCFFFRVRNPIPQNAKPQGILFNLLISHVRDDEGKDTEHKIIINIKRINLNTLIRNFKSPRL